MNKWRGLSINELEILQDSLEFATDQYSGSWRTIADDLLESVKREVNHRKALGMDFGGL